MLKQSSRSFVVDDVAPEHSLRSYIQFPPPPRSRVFVARPTPYTHPSLLNFGDDGVVEKMSRRATVHQHIYGVVATACPQPHSGNDRESRPVLRTGDAPKDVGRSIGDFDRLGITVLAKREPHTKYINSHHN